MIQTLIFSALSFVLGAVIVYFLRASQIARLAERVSGYESQLSTAKITTEQLQNEFKLSAIEALRQVKAEAGQEIQRDKQEVSSSVREMKEKLGEYQALVKKFETERFEMYGKIESSLNQVLSAETAIRMETSSLKRALTSSSGVRGKWGETVLQQILERSNLVKGINFDTQVTMGDSDSSNRPDFIVYLPHGKKIVIDSKEVAAEYILAQETDDPLKQKEHYDRLLVNIRSNLVKLSRKEYQTHVDPEIPYVVMFIPSEAVIRAAFSLDIGLFQEAMDRKVIIASPMTILPLLSLVAHTWAQKQLADNAAELGASVEELGNRLCTFMEHLQSIQQGIRKTTDGWNKAVGSWQKKVSPQIERSRLLGGKLKEADEPAPIDTDLRSLNEENLLQQ